MVAEKIKQSGLSEKIKMMGSRPLSQIAEAYQNADVFVLPSLRETSGNVLLEAMAYAIPIVSFDTSFCSELAKHECGIFINTNQPLEAIQKDYANAIVTLIQDRTLGEQLGQNGYGYVNSELSWDEKYNKVYD